MFPSNEVAGFKNLLVNLFEFQRAIRRCRGQLCEKFTEDTSLDTTHDFSKYSIASTHCLCLLRWFGHMHEQLIGFAQ